MMSSYLSVEAMLKDMLVQKDAEITRLRAELARTALMLDLLRGSGTAQLVTPDFPPGSVTIAKETEE